MIHSKSNKRPKPNKLVPTKSSPAKVAVMPSAGPSHNMIRERAYEIYESRGSQPGQDKQDWLHAEQEILISSTAGFAEDRRAVWSA
jgi:hypothetical protein